MNARRVVVLVGALAAIAMPVSARAQQTFTVPTVTASGTISKPGNATVLPLIPGQNTCLIQLSGATTFTATAEGFTGGIWDFVPGFGVGNVMTSAGTFVGTINVQTFTYSAFTFAVVSLAAGQTLTYTETCGPPATAITTQ